MTATSFSASPLRGLAAVFAWLRATRDREPPEVRARLIQTILDRKAPLVFGIVCVSIMAAIAGIRTGEAWPWLWIVVELALSGARLGFLVHAPRDDGRMRRPYVDLLMGLGLLWCALFGIGCYLCVATGDPVLILMAGITMAGVIGAITSRNAGVPRFGVAAIAFCALPYGAAMLRADGLGPQFEGMSLIALMIPLWMGVMAAILYQNYDITVRMIRAELATRVLARTDGLTGMSNRLHLEETLDALCGDGAGPARPRFTLLCIDLDGFKAVNDGYGHSAGDRLLAAVARRLARVIRDGDRLFRLGGDEFVVLLPEATPGEAAFIASRIIAGIGRPFEIGVGETVGIGASIGSVRAPEDGTTAPRLLSLADAALYRAKNDGKGLYRAHHEGGASAA